MNLIYGLDIENAEIECARHSLKDIVITLAP